MPPLAAPFAMMRGPLEAAQVRLHSGAADVRMTASAEAGALATGQFPGRPRLNLDGTRATLAFHRRFSPTWAPPQRWAIALGRGVAWSLGLASSLGDFDVDLRDLTAASVSLHSFAGDVRLVLPAAGQGTADIRLILGNLSLRVPDGLAIKLKLKTGWLSKAPLDAGRFIRTAPDEWVTPNFSAAPNRCALTVMLTTGDLIIE